MAMKPDNMLPEAKVPTAGSQVGQVQFFLETPESGTRIAGAFVPVRGWVFHPDGIETVEARTTRGAVPALIRFGRADVFKALNEHPLAFHTGFYMEIEHDVWSAGAELWVETCKGEWARFHALDSELDDSSFVQAQKTVMEILACPSCLKSLDFRAPACAGCGRPVVWMGDVPSFLGPQPSPLARGEQVSRHPVTEIIPEYLDLESGGLFLDDGAGWPPDSRPDIIQVEIERFPSTNVVADGAELPFKPETFDGIISHAVMEHVKDPFGYAADLVRVLKPGGRFICHSAFLQPLHGYPHHYFNTTLEGLKVLFDGVKIIDSGVSKFQLPWVTLEWVLRSYCAGFTDVDERERFKNMKISELLGDMDEDRPLRQFQSLTEDTTLELAAGVYILGER